MIKHMARFGNKRLRINPFLALGGILLCFGIVFSVIRHSSHPNNTDTLSRTKKTVTKSIESPPIKKLDGDRWESKQKIYFNIPARILITSPGADEELVHRIIDKAWMEFERIGQIFNPFDPDSEVAGINQESAAGWINVSNDLYSVLKISQNLWRESNGDLDPTFLPIKQLWHRAEKKQGIPSERKILQTLQKTGFENVAIEPDVTNKIRIKSPPIHFDFGGIAKGYAVDRVRQLLNKNGISDGLVQLGGEIAAFGQNAGLPWRIGIQHPKNMVQVWGIISHPSKIRISTSGNYRQPLKIQGQSFYHIFSPQTGKPVSEKVLGVTTLSIIESHSNALLDGAATAITVMGAENGVKFAEKMDIEALILTQGHDQEIKETMTPGFSVFYRR